MTTDPEVLVDKANQVLEVYHLRLDRTTGSAYHVFCSVYTSVLCASDVPKDVQEALWVLFDDNMGKLAAGTSLATPKDEKLEELFDPATRFIIYSSVPLGSDAADSDNFAQDKLLGFASIRFDTEDTLDSQEYEDGVRATVVYIYELQVASYTRALGLGRRLLSECEALGEAIGLQKTMLTCLKNNGQGLRFYMHNG
ncbi:hypothetical protein QFC21_004336 [Naganishia friedmannii]|uniref:Uncharacterized protein n=1 Tax=Naganishia friedmannii TaxID=89922 RepID=A0ACC2VHZ7_9TREE|nr:hypothetical protein QFC21_004336 [Naganishia friedmannii]